MTRERPPITGITGGSHGLAATYAKVRALATRYDTAGRRMRGWAGVGGHTLGNADLLESSVLSPATFAEAETAVLAATTGTDGILVASVGWRTDALLVRVTVRSFEETDDLVRGSFDVLDHLIGRALGTALPGALVVGAPLLLGAAVVVGPHAEVRGTRTSDDVQEWLHRHPALVQHLVNGAGGLLDGLWDGLTPGPFGPGMLPTFHPDTESAAGTLAGLFDDGEAEVTRRDDLTVDSGGRQPGCLADVLRHLDETDNLAGNGTIEVQTITGPGGTVGHIVYLPGTDDMATLPWTQDGDVRDLGTNFALIGGDDTAYARGILEAMAQAGIESGEPVMLVGHSQGGMAAAHLVHAGTPYDITQVITTGSPTAHVPGLPGDVPVMSFENRGDVVPLLDGEDNADTTHQVTIRFDDHETSVVGNHGIPHYVNGARAADASDHPSIVDQVAGMREQGFLSRGDPGTGSTSQVFQITRRH